MSRALPLTYTALAQYRAMKDVKTRMMEGCSRGEGERRLQVLHLVTLTETLSPGVEPGQDPVARREGVEGLRELGMSREQAEQTLSAVSFMLSFPPPIGEEVSVRPGDEGDVLVDGESFFVGEEFLDGPGWQRLPDDSELEVLATSALKHALLPDTGQGGWDVDVGTMAWLRDRLGVANEAFTTPFQRRFPAFYTAFPEVDRLLGSRGRFLGSDMVLGMPWVSDAGIVVGWWVDVPPIFRVARAVADMVQEACDRACGIGQPFVVFLRWGRGTGEAMEGKAGVPLWSDGQVHCFGSCLPEWYPSLVREGFESE